MTVLIAIPATVDHVRQRDIEALTDIRGQIANGRAKAARKAAAIRQHEIAAALGVVPSTISQWASGKRVPSAEHALAYGKLLRQLARKAA